MPKNNIMMKLLIVTLVTIVLVMPASASIIDCAIINNVDEESILITAPKTTLIDLPISFDLRDVDGVNYVPRLEIKDHTAPAGAMEQWLQLKVIY